MRKKPSLTLILSFALFSVLSASTTSSAVRTGAQAVDEAWSKAVVANDLNAVMSCYSNDAVMWLPGAPEAQGHDAIRASYAALFAANTVTNASFADTHYVTNGNLSVGWGTLTLSLSPKSGGDPVVMSGRFSVIAKRDGKNWVYIVDHASSGPAPAPQH